MQYLVHAILPGLAASALTFAAVRADVPASITAPGEVQVALIHAQGSQVYECKTGANGTSIWTFREPIAALIENGLTIGRHYAGPTWELDDGSRITGNVIARAPSTTALDIPQLKLAVASSNGIGRLADATTIQRLNTKGGTAEGTCDRPGTLLNVPYSADYAVLKRAK